MDISIDAFKQLITDNPGIDNQAVQEYFEVDKGTLGRWIVRLKDCREKNGKKSWVFIQAFHKKSVYFSRDYAVKNHIQPKVVAPKKRNRKVSKNAGEDKQRAEEKKIRELSKLFVVPKGVV